MTREQRNPAVSRGGGVMTHRHAPRTQLRAGRVVLPFDKPNWENDDG